MCCAAAPRLRRLGAHARRHALACSVAVGAALPLAAPAQTAPNVIEVQIDRTPAPASAAMQAFDRAAAAIEQRATLRARSWMGSGGVGVGVGADLSAPGDTVGWRTVLGMRADLGANARMVYELHPDWPARGAEGSPPGRLMLEYRSARPLHDLRDQLLRVELSGSSSLHLRPRRSGMMVTWRAQF